MENFEQEHQGMMTQSEQEKYEQYLSEQAKIKAELEIPQVKEEREHAEEPQTEPKQSENPDQSENKLQRQSLLDRLASYSIVNTAFTTYGNIKNYNSLLNTGLSLAENTTAAAIAYTTPVILPRVQPIFNAIDERINVEETGNQILDRIEAQVANATEKIINTNAYIQTTKNNAQDMVYGLPHKSYEVLVDRPLEQILERLEALLDKFLPPTFAVEKLELDGEISKSTRIMTIGKEVPKRIVNLAHQKYQGLHLTEEQLQSFAFLVDLIQYAVDTIDVHSKKAKNKANEVIISASEMVAEKKNQVENKISDISTAIKTNADNVNTQYISPIRSAIEERLSEIKQTELQSYVGVMATIAHAAELAKRQLFMRLGDSQNLMAELQTYLDSSKKAVLSFDKNQLPIYLQSMKTNASQALSSILSLITTYTPSELLHKLPSFSHISQNLENWRLSLEQRLISMSSENEVKNNDSKEVNNTDPVQESK